MNVECWTGDKLIEKLLSSRLTTIQFNIILNIKAHGVLLLHVASKVSMTAGAGRDHPTYLKVPVSVLVRTCFRPRGVLKTCCSSRSQRGRLERSYDNPERSPRRL